jgi:hypothetical protein
VFDLGDTAFLAFTVTSTADRKVDATVVLTITKPDGTTVTPSVDHDAVGEYSVSYVPTVEGRHVIRWTATGTATKARTDILNVRPAAPAAILSLAEAREHINFADVDEGVDDEELREFVEAASRVVERHLGQVVARRSFTEQRKIRPSCSAQVILTNTPVFDITTVASVDGSRTWDPDDLDWSPRTGTVTVREGNLFSGRINITYVAGEQHIPENWAKACGIICGHLWETQRLVTLGRQPSRLWGLAQTSDEGIMTPRGTGYAIPHRAVELLGARRPLV